jgi:hypothetical protein
VLQTHTKLFYSDKIHSQKDSIINLLNQTILLKDIRILEAKQLSREQETIIKAQKKRIFWRGVEIWGYRIGILAGVGLLIFSQ